MAECARKGGDLTVPLTDQELVYQRIARCKQLAAQDETRIDDPHFILGLKPDEIVDEQNVVYWSDLGEQPGYRENDWRLRGNELIDRVAHHVREAGRRNLWWWVMPGTTPHNMGDLLRQRGLRPVAADEFMVWRLGSGPQPFLPASGDVTGVTVQQVTNIDEMRTSWQIKSEVLAWGPPREARIRALLAEQAPPLPQHVQFLATIDNTPAATGGVSVYEGGRANLYDAATLPNFRSQGAYRALVRARMAAAFHLGADTVTTVANVTTAAPILRRMEFRSLGREDTFGGVIEP